MRLIRRVKTKESDRLPIDTAAVDRLFRKIEDLQSQVTELSEELAAAKAALDDTHSRFDAFQTLSNVGLLTLDRAGRIRDLNDTATQLLGQKDLPIGRPLVSFVTHESVRTYLNHLLRCVGESRAVSSTVTLHVADRNIPVRMNTLRSSRNGNSYYHVALIDQSQMKSVEADLQTTLESWRALVEGAPDIVMLLTVEGRITFANRTWSGCSASELVGMELFDTLPPEEHRKAGQCLVKVISGGMMQSCEMRCTNEHGESWFNLRFGRLESVEPASPSLFLLIRDISEQKLSEAELIRRAERMGKLSAHTDQIREDERTRIGREIHDEMGQSLTVLKMDLAWLKTRFSKRQLSSLERSNGMDQTLDQLIRTVRRIASELGPPVLLELGLVPAIEWQLEQFEKRFGIRCHVDVRQPELMMDKERSTVIFRVVQEALTNVARHAGASSVEFSLDVRDDCVFIRIEDNGSGITERQINHPSSVGLMGMRERTARVNGFFFIERLDAGGTRVTVRVPLEDNQPVVT